MERKGETQRKNKRDKGNQFKHAKKKKEKKEKERESESKGFSETAVGSRPESNPLV